VEETCFIVPSAFVQNVRDEIAVDGIGGVTVAA
jgi:hypothetical protein